MALTWQIGVGTLLFAGTWVGAVPSSLAYQLQDDYTIADFFTRFELFTDQDPTHGFVQYVNQSFAEEHNLIATYRDHVHIGVDHTRVFSTSNPADTANGRPSVRLQSKDVYTHGLFVLNLSHMPYGCAVWPSWWTLGSDWPAHGEIDIIENVNTATANLMSLHTSRGCTIAGSDELGILHASDYYSDGGAHVGCSVQSSANISFGSAFNFNGGGTFAMEWTTSSIKIWSWKAGSEPSDLDSDNPDPTNWDLPAANFQGSCDIDSHFHQHQIIFDITFCGDFAGSTYGSTSCVQTPGLSSRDSCNMFVAHSPSAFQDTYWDINYLRVFQRSKSPPATSSSTTTLSSVTPVSISISAGIEQGAPTTETTSDSGAVAKPPQPFNMVSPTTVYTAGAYTHTACLVNNVIPTGAAHYSKVVSSVEDCSNWCYSSSSGGTYIGMAVENGVDCYCFNEPGVPSPTAASGCTIPCVSSTAEICGGSTVVNVYVLSGLSYTQTSQSGAHGSPTQSPPSGPKTASTTTGTGSGSTTATTASLSTVTYPDTPSPHAYYVDQYDDQARIYSGATIQNGNILPARYGGYIQANDFVDCIEQGDDANEDEAGWSYMYLRAVIYLNGTDADPDQNCILIGDSKCMAPDGTDLCASYPTANVAAHGEDVSDRDSDGNEATSFTDGTEKQAGSDKVPQIKRQVSSTVRRQYSGPLAMAAQPDSYVAYFVFAPQEATPNDPVDAADSYSSLTTSSTTSSTVPSNTSTTGTGTTSTNTTNTTSIGSSSSSTSGTLDGADPATTPGSPDPESPVVSVIYVTTCSPPPAVDMAEVSISSARSAFFSS